MKNKVRFVLFIISIIAVSFFAPLKSFQLKWLIDSKSKEEALGYLVIIFLITILNWLFEYFSRKLFTNFACDEIEKIRNRIMNNVLHRSIEQYNNESDAVYLSLLTNDLRTIYDDYYMSIFNMIFWGGIMACTLGMYLYISPILLIAILVIAIPPLMLPRIMNAKLKKARDTFSQQMITYTQYLKELLGGFEVIRDFLREDAYNREHLKVSYETKKSECTYQQGLNNVIVNTSLISNLIFPVVLLIGLFLVFAGDITVGTMSTAASMANFVITPCHQIAQAYAKVKATKGIRGRLQVAMASQKDKEGSQLDSPIKEVKCERVTFTYPESNRRVVSEVTFTIKSGQKFALVGESGCGKSTFAKLLLQYYQEYKGGILINGRQIKELERKSLYKRVGYIAQTTYLFNDTIYNNICLKEVFSDEQVRLAVESSGLLAWIQTLPNRLDTVLSENGKNLSGGQRQRIGIARLILRKYDFIVADEITANLDTETSQQIMEKLLKMSSSMLVITHDISSRFLKQFDEVYQMKEGKINLIEKGGDL